MQIKLLSFLLISISCLTYVSAQTQKPKSIAAGVINGKATSLPKPDYPAAAQAVKASGAVNVQVTINENGEVIFASAISGHPLLRQAAEQAALQAAFNPTLLSGQPVKVTGVIIYNFVAAKDSSNEEKLRIMGLGAFLTVSDLMPNDEWEIFSKEDLKEAPQIAKELEPLILINKQTSKEKRLEIVAQVINALDNKLTGEDAWQFRFGKELGGLMTEIGKVQSVADKNLNETAVKTKLYSIRNLLFEAPDDFPLDVLKKFKEIVKFAEVENLNSTDNKLRFIELLGETLEIISPDSAEK